MNYPESLKYLYSFLNYEIQTDYHYRKDLNLKRMAFLMKLFGHPERKISFVLVGGTKGKGSTAYLLSSIVQEAGHRVGLYTSPHLREPAERIVVSGLKISRDDFAHLFSEIRERLAAEPMLLHLGRITFFELLTTAALRYFFKRKVELAVLEVGMGGRLDATNIVHPLISILTPVSYDHQDKLGHSLLKIAGEKIPIVKPHTFFVCGPQTDTVRALAAGWAQKKRARPFFFGQDFRVTGERLTDRGSTFDLATGHRFWKDFYLSLPGRFQIENAACAVQAAVILDRASSFKVDETALRRGLARAFWPGRFEIVGRNPLILLDGAHNGASFRALRESVQDLFPGRPLNLILAVSRGKDLPRIFREIVRLKPRRLIVTEMKNPRALSAQELVVQARRRFGYAEESQDLKESLQLALQNRQPEDIFIIAGSLFLVGEAENLLASSPGFLKVA